MEINRRKSFVYPMRFLSLAGAFLTGMEHGAGMESNISTYMNTCFTTMCSLVIPVVSKPISKDYSELEKKCSGKMDCDDLIMKDAGYCAALAAAGYSAGRLISSYILKQ